MKSYKTLSLLLSVMVILSMTVAVAPAASAGPAPIVKTQSGDEATLGYDPDTGQLIFVGTEGDGVIASSGGTGGAMDFVNAYGAAFGLSNPSTDVVETSARQRGGNTVTRYQQLHQGVPVFGGNLVVNTAESGGLVAMAGKISSSLTVDINPTQTTNQAIAAAQAVTLKSHAKYNLKASDLSFSAPALWVYDEKIFTESSAAPQLVWRVEVTAKNAPVHEVVLVNAKVGKVAVHYNKIDDEWSSITTGKSDPKKNYTGSDVTAQALGTPDWAVWDNANTTTDPDTTVLGAAACVDEDVDCSDDNVQVDIARIHLLNTYNFYATYHGRDSIDGSGMQLKSVVRYGGTMLSSTWYYNAYWDGTKMVYGDWLAVDDVTAHELTHGVTEDESGLLYLFQPGAINESFSDVWGEYIDLKYSADFYSGAEWLMGEDILGPAYAFRSMKDPTKFKDPDRMGSSYYVKNGTDYGGVHTNSGVNNKAAYLMVEGGKFNKQTITGIGIDKAAAIYYRVQVNYLYPSANYLDLFYSLNAACSDLIGGAEGITTDDCNQVYKVTLATQMNIKPSSVANVPVDYCPVNTSYGNTLFYDSFSTGLGDWSTEAYGDGASTPASWTTTIDNPLWWGDDVLWAPGMDGLNNGTFDGGEEMIQFFSGEALPAGQQIYLTFYHMYNMEQSKNSKGTLINWDGAILEYTTDGGATWKNAKPLFSGGVNYNGKILSGNPDNPLTGQEAFIGAGRQYPQRMRYNLTSLAGQTVNFRWHVGYDYYTDWGWFIDDVDLHTCSPVPAIPALVSPANNALDTTYSPVLDWKDVTKDLDHYYIEIATDKDFFFIEDSANTGTNSYYTPTLLPNTTYYWRVRAENAFSGYKGWSTVRSLRAVMSTPALLTPIDPTDTTVRRPVFDWSDVAGADKYTLVVSKSSTFKGTPALKVNVVGSTYTPTKDLPTGQLYWRVQGTGVNGPSLWSDVYNLNIAAPLADDDGDGLPNDWEINGYDADGDTFIDVDLPAMGANYLHKDIFVEMDYMVRVSATNGLAPSPAVLTSIEESFADSPVTNPDGITGINIHLELDDEVTYDDDLNDYITEFYALKAANFDANRTATHHYMIWANGYNAGSSSGVSYGLPATDFIVTLGLWNANAGGTDDQKVGTFIHELGHNLNLTHGGSDHVNYKPNYLSVMNYFFQMTGVYRDSEYHFDYQRITTAEINEANLKESVGINSPAANADGYQTKRYCGSTQYLTPVSPIDWNCDSDTADSGVSYDVNNDGFITKLKAQDNWANIVYDGGGIIGSGLSPEALAAFIEARDIPFIEELTWEMQQQIDALMQP